MILSKLAKTQSNKHSKQHNRNQILDDLETYKFKSINHSLSPFDLYCLNLLFRSDGIIYDLYERIIS